MPQPKSNVVKIAVGPRGAPGYPAALVATTLATNPVLGINVTSPLFINSTSPATPTISLKIVPIVLGGTGTSNPSLIAGPGISISGAWPDQKITATGVPTSVVTSLDAMSGALKIVAGANISVTDGVPSTPTANTITIAAPNVVTALNTLIGAVTLAAGTNVTITPAGNTLTIASTGGAVATPIIIASGVTYTVADNTQVTYSVPIYIQAGGSLVTLGSGTLSWVN